MAKEVEGEVPMPEGVAERTPTLRDDATGENDITNMPKGTMKLTKGKKYIVDVSEQMVSKKTRLSSHYTISPYTVEAKKRTFVDGTFPNLLCKVPGEKESV